MPGSPPYSPRFGVPRPADTDTAAFSTQFNAATDTFDARAAMTWRYLAKSSAYTAVEGDFVYAAAGVAVTLPGATAGIAVAVQGDTSVTGASPATVSAAGGAEIRGGGLASTATSFALGTPGATAVLVADGTNWHFVSGQQDTGWVALTLTSGYTTLSGSYAAAVRVVGNSAELRGAIVANGTGTQWATVPTAAKPAAEVNFGLLAGPATGSLSVDGFCGISTAGAVTTGSPASGWILGLDGQRYSLG